MRVTRRIEFDAAHRVMRHESKCSTLHGHRYVCEITCEADELDEIGRVVDFGQIKAKVGAWIDANWDHTTLVNRDDDRLVSWCYDESRAFAKKPPYVFDGEPTAENIGRVLFIVASGMLDRDGMEVVHVRIYETPNCWADYDGYEGES